LNIKTFVEVPQKWGRSTQIAARVPRCPFADPHTAADGVFANAHNRGWANAQQTTHTMNTIDTVGSLAAILTTASFVPQAWQTFRTREVSGISLVMYSLFTAGVALWLVYGILIMAWPIIVANVITTSLALMILAMKLRYSKPRV
jgi:MtN3 and saliva related transmembrane protein